MDERGRDTDDHSVPQKRGCGRPSPFKPEFSAQAQALCKLGATDAELASFFGVNLSTIRNWRVNHDAFFHALKRGKEAADDRVADSLFSRATGYSYETEKVFQHRGKVVRAKVTEHVPPDTTACIFWLKNRRPDLWRDVTRQEQTGRDGGPIEVTASARDAVIERIKAIASRLPESETEAEAPFVRG